MSGAGKPKSKITALFDGLVDLVEYDGKPAFLVKEGDKIAIHHEVNNGDIVLVPPEIENIPWLLPRGEKVLEVYSLEKQLPKEEADKAVFEDLLAYHRSVSELPKDDHYYLLALWVLHTYLIDQAQFSPIISFVTRHPERGKSRTGKGLIYVCRRGILTGGVSPAYFIRMSERYQAAIFIDVKDIVSRMKTGRGEDLILNRFERGVTAARVTPGKRGFDDVTHYSVFGPTVLASNVPVDSFIESRGISIELKKSGRIFNNNVTPESCLELKERLTSFRIRHCQDSLPVIDKVVPGRLGDAFRPLHQVVRMVNPGWEKSLINMIKKVKRNDTPVGPDTFDNRVLRTVMNLVNQTMTDTVSIKVIAGCLIEGKHGEVQLSLCKRVGHTLGRLGFEKTRVGAGGNTAIIIDRILLDNLKEKYGI